MTESDRDPNAVLASRRAVLVGAGAVGLTGVLAACGGEAAPTSNQTRQPAGEESEPTAPETTAPSDAEPAAEGIPASEIPVGSGKIFADRNIVVTQPTQGEFMAFSAECTHMGCRLARVNGDAIECTCHGSRFNLNGSVKTGPASAPLSRRNVTVQGDSLIIG